MREEWKICEACWWLILPVDQVHHCSTCGTEPLCTRCVIREEHACDDAGGGEDDWLEDSITRTRELLAELPAWKKQALAFEVQFREARAIHRAPVGGYTSRAVGHVSPDETWEWYEGDDDQEGGEG